MVSQSDLTALTPNERRDYGFARVRDAAFDAVLSLWVRRQAEGMTQADLAAAIDADTGWISKNMRGPGNWTMRTFGSLVEAMRGEAQIRVRALEDPLPAMNYHAYVDYEPTTMDIGGLSSTMPKDMSISTPTSAKQNRSVGRPIITTLIP
jgi:hypothetical protein